MLPFISQDGLLPLSEMNCQQTRRSARDPCGGIIVMAKIQHMSEERAKFSINRR